MSHPLLAFHIDSTFPQVASDLTLLLLIALNLLLGWRYGLMRRLIALLGTYLALLGATATGNGVAALIKPHDLYVNAWTYIGIFVVIVIMIEALGALYNDQIQKLIVVTFDRISGLVAGGVLGFFEACLIFMIALAVGNAPATATAGSDHGLTAQAVQNATLTEYVVKVIPAITTIYSPALPADLPGHLAEGTDTNGSTPTLH